MYKFSNSLYFLKKNLFILQTEGMRFTTLSAGYLDHVAACLISYACGAQHFHSLTVPIHILAPPRTAPQLVPTARMDAGV